jgi:hypothetical protein
MRLRHADAGRDRRYAAEPVQPASLDGVYKGSMACERTTGGVATFHGTLAITVRDGRHVMAATPTFDAEGRKQLLLGWATGIVDPNGEFRVGFVAYMRDDTLHADYSGTISATGGTLTGTEVWTRATGEDVTRSCKGEFVRVERPAQ